MSNTTNSEDVAEVKVRGDVSLFKTLFTIFTASILYWVISSTFEANSYEYITGKHVTVWDAMWVDFVVQNGAK